MVHGVAKISLQRCTAALRALSGASSWPCALQLLTELHASRLRRDLICMNATLAACARGAVPHVALVLLNEASAASLSPDTVSYNATITAHGRALEWQRALEWHGKMRVRSVAYSTASFGAAIDACSKVGKWQMALVLWKCLSCELLDSNPIIVGAVIGALRRGNQWQRAIQVMHEAHSAGLADSVAHNVALAACTDATAWPMALAMLREPAMNENYKADNTSARIIAVACRAARVWHEGLTSLVKSMTSPRDVAATPLGSVGSGSVDLPTQSGASAHCATEAWARTRAEGHTPVLNNHIVDVLLAGEVRGAFADCTFGRGGHTRALLSRLPADATVFAFDVDPTAIEVARRLAELDGRLVPLHRPFGDLEAVLPTAVPLAGVLADLGVSSPQLDQRGRGFSVSEDGPLDLRMNPHMGISAAEWLQHVSAEELAWIIHEHGEDGDPLVAARIAEAVIVAVKRRPLLRTRQLSEVVQMVKAGHARNPFQQPARLTFQAIRTFLNREFEQLECLLQAALRRLEMHGRLVVICFKRTEVAAVRRFLRAHEEPRQPSEWWERRARGEVEKLFPLLVHGLEAVPWQFRELCAPLVPSAKELHANTRARSAQALVLEKLPRKIKF